MDRQWQRLSQLAKKRVEVPTFPSPSYEQHVVDLSYYYAEGETPVWVTSPPVSVRGATLRGALAGVIIAVTQRNILGTDTKDPKLAISGIALGAAQWLVYSRKIKAFGIDTVSVDHGPSDQFATHLILLASHIFGLENVASVDILPATEATVIGLPMDICGGTGAALRIIALVPSSTRSFSLVVRKLLGP